MTRRITLKSFFQASLILGALLFTSCLTDDGPSGPTCDNTSAAGPACTDCDATNPAHLACYVSTTCDNTSATGPACNDCDPSNAAHLACYDAFTYAVFPIFEMSCNGCHSMGGSGEFSTGGTETGLSMDTPEHAYNRLLMASFGDSGATQRVVPGDKSASSLYNKISEQDDVWFGIPMPGGWALINDDTAAVNIIGQWIDNGAKAPGTIVTPPIP